MGSKAQAKANSENAKRMKDLGIRRSTGSCPMGCGAQIALGGGPLVFHLGRCSGKKN
jgi:hypothetical protein